MSENKQEYFGDGVYGSFDGWGLELAINDPANPTDRVYLERNVLLSLIHFAIRKEMISKEEI